MTSRLDAILADRSDDRRRRKLWRRERVVALDGEPRVFCSNDYLGVATRGLLDVGEAAGGFGGAASRLIAGTTSVHAALERELAEWMGTESSRYFATGYQANVGLLSSLIDRDDLVFSDALNHASIIDGIRLSRAETHIFEHANLAALEERLRATRSHEGMRWIVTDAIFSMDGDLADIAALVDLAERYDAALYVDEAHAIGVYGDAGQGLCASLGLIDRVDVVVGTCGKSMGTAGAFVAGSQILSDYVYNSARSFVFSTAPPPIVCDAVRRAILLLRRTDLQRALWENIGTFADLLRARGWWRGQPRSPIFPVVLGDEAVAVAVSEDLLRRGYFVHPIRPPTVPSGTSRLRVTLGAQQTCEELADFVSALAESVESLDCSPVEWSHGP